jgi:hypothetical protein
MEPVIMNMVSNVARFKPAFEKRDKKAEDD